MSEVSETTCASCTRPGAPAGARRGATLVSLLLVAGGLCFASAMIVDLVLMRNYRTQLHAACRSAALAGAPELMDRGVLYPDQLIRSIQNPSDLGPGYVQQVAVARQQAVTFAARNILGRQPVALQPNVNNEVQGDIVVGWLPDPQSLTSQIEVEPAGSPTIGLSNTVLVRCNRTRARSNPVSLWVGRAMGLDAVDLVGIAQATVDQRVYGFRQAGHVPVPAVLLPLASGHWFPTVYGAPGHPIIDDVTVNDTTGQISTGGDGIPEITFELAFKPWPSSLQNGIGPPHAWLIRQDTGRFDAMEFAQQVVGGATTEDLDFCGGELNRLSPSSRHCAVYQGLDARSLRALGAALLAIRGQKRIWPLAVGRSRSNTRIFLREFGAAQLVDARLNDDNSGLIIVVQPCLIVTPTALTDPSQEWNPWIGKLMITG